MNSNNVKLNAQCAEKNFFQEVCHYFICFADWHKSMLIHMHLSVIISMDNSYSSVLDINIHLNVDKRKKREPRIEIGNSNTG